MGFSKRRGISTQTQGELYRVGDGNGRVTVIAVSRGTTKDWPLADRSQEEARRGHTLAHVPADFQPPEEWPDKLCYLRLPGW